MSDGLPWIRVSCGCLCRIEHLKRYLLLLNANLRSKNVYRLSPIGGALSVYDPVRLSHFNAVPENAASSDLRLRMPLDSLPLFREWFYTGQDREHSPLRELQEELVIESRLLPHLNPDEVSWEYLWTVEQESLTQRKGQTGALTHYFLEIFDVKFKRESALGPLLAAPPESGAMWLTADQINERGTVRLPIDGSPREVHVFGYLLLQPPQKNESVLEDSRS